MHRLAVGEFVRIRNVLTTYMHGHLAADKFGNSFQHRHGDGSGNNIMACLVQLMGQKNDAAAPLI